MLRIIVISQAFGLYTIHFLYKLANLNVLYIVNFNYKTPDVHIESKMFTGFPRLS